MARLAGAGAIFVSVNTNSSISINHTNFDGNFCHYNGGGINLRGSGRKEVSIMHSTFEGNWNYRAGGALSVTRGTIQLFIQHSVFRNNRAPNGGAIDIYLQDDSTATVSDSVFENNSVSSDGSSQYLEDSLGGAVNVKMEEDPLISPGCIKPELNSTEQHWLPRSDSNAAYRRWLYYNHVQFTSTLFHDNTALKGGALSLTNGKTVIQNCTFLNNFASFQGGVIFADGESTALVLSDSTIQQVKPPPVVIINKANIPCTGSFIHSQSSGPLVLRNTTMDWRPPGNIDPFIQIVKGGPVDFDESTSSLCPVGHQMQFQNFSHTFTFKPYCDIRVTIFKLSCHSCGSNLYSLQRGQTQGLGNVTKVFKCLPCPYGADCSSDRFGIVARPNFWGFKLDTVSPALNFTTCPLGYCKVPMPSTAIMCNGCQGNRTGTLCGQCYKNYTETLFSTDCRRKSYCNDYWIWPVALVFIAGFAIYLVKKPPFLSSVRRNILWYYNRNAGLASSVTHVQVNNKPDAGYLKIIFYYYQVANLLLISSSAELVVSTYFLRPVIGLFNFQQLVVEDGLVCPFNGLTVVTKQLLMASEVIVTLLAVVVLYALHFLVNCAIGRQRANIGPYLGAAMETMLLGYSTLASVSFKLLQCVSLGIHGDVLFIDGNVSCYQWWQYFFITCNIVFVVPFIVVLAWGSVKLYHGSVTVRQLIFGCLFPLPVLTYWAIYGLCSTPVQYDEADTAGPVKRALYGPFREPKGAQKGALYWESVLIGRRLVLIILHTFIIDTLVRLLTMGFVCVVILSSHIIIRPFRSATANIAESCSLLSLVVIATINMYRASFISAGVEPGGPTSEVMGHVSQWTEDVLLGIVPCVFFLVVFVGVVSQIARALHWCCYWCCSALCRCWLCCRKADDELRLLLANAASSESG